MPLGGASIFVLNLCEGLKNIGGYEPIVAVMREESDIGTQIRDRGYEVIGANRKALIHEDRIEYLYKQCQKFSPVAVIAVLGGGEAFNFLRSVPQGVLRIAMLHSDDECVYQTIERYLPWTDLIVGVSQEICMKIKERIFPSATPVLQIACGIPIPEPNAIRNIPTDEIMRIIYVGRIDDEAKRIRLMTRIMDKTIESGNALTWTVVGDGPLLPLLKEKYGDRPNKVKILGAIPYDQVSSILYHHDVFFLCSDYEGLPLSLLEAMASGLAPVVSDLPSGISEVIHEGNGIRVPIHDEDAYVKALLDLATDPIRREKLASQARRDVINSYSNEAMASRWNHALNYYNLNSNVSWLKKCKSRCPAHADGHIIHKPIFRFLRRLRVLIK